MGLTSAVLIAPAALHVALREFQTWYQDYAETWNQQALHNQNWLQPISASQPELAAYFPHVRTLYESTVIVLQEDWSIPTSEVDTRKQHVITQCMKDKLKAAFVSDLPADDVYRIEQVSLSSCPTRSSTSDINPALSHDSDSLRQCPIGHFSLTCPFELSNAALHTSTAILFGYPVPHARFLQTRHVPYPCDQWAACC